MIRIETEAKFEAAHRQFGDPDKCGKVHGHNWMVRVAIVGEVVDSLGYLVDFKAIKTLIREYDHTIMLWAQDTLEFNEPQKIVYLGKNPTCENIAQILVDRIRAEIASGDNIEYIEVTVYENDESTATAIWPSGES